MQPIWREVQSTVESGHVGNVGVCDFDRAGLDQLYDWATVSLSFIEFTQYWFVCWKVVVTAIEDCNW